VPALAHAHHDHPARNGQHGLHGLHKALVQVVCEASHCGRFDIECFSGKVERALRVKAL
jgi:hypothetical protein